MKNKVEIIHNPYKQNLRILINNNSASSYGTLEQYQDEPFTNWCDKIFDDIYRECNESAYELHFSGREEEHSIMQKLADSRKECTYLYRPYENRIIFQQRMKLLSELLKQFQINNISQDVFYMEFCVSKKYEHMKEMLQTLNLVNSYCKAIPCVYDIENTQFKENQAVFVISDDLNVKTLSKYSHRYIFGIKMGDRKGFVEKRNRIFIYDTTEQELMSTIFECMLLAPLMNSFHKCIVFLQSYYSNNADMMKKINKICSIESEVILDIESTTIELGKSILIRMKKENGQPLERKILFEYSQVGIIECNGLRINGLREGKTNLFLFHEGENIPFEKINFTVIKRNRITKLQLEEKFIRLGEGERYQISMTYFPIDADNVDTINWISDNEQVAVVDKYGKITAKKAGQCRFVCTAEQVSAFCNCEVLAYMNSIDTGIEDDKLVMYLGQERELNIHYKPQKCIDKPVTITSNNVQIVNVINHKLIAVSYGECVITIKSKSGRVRKTVNVTVEKPYVEETVRKKGFWAKLFEKIFGL